MKIKYLENCESSVRFKNDFFSFFNYVLEKQIIEELDFFDEEIYYIVDGTFEPIGITGRLKKKIPEELISSLGDRMIAINQRPYIYFFHVELWNGIGVYQPVLGPNMMGFYGLKEAFNPADHKFEDKIYLDKYVFATSIKHDSFFPMLKDYLENYHKILQAKKI